MIELFANIVIVVSSAALFAYWLRYAWFLIWNQKAGEPSEWRNYRAPGKPSGRP